MMLVDLCVSSHGARSEKAPRAEVLNPAICSSISDILNFPCALVDSTQKHALELVAAQPAVDGDDRAGNVTRQRRGEKYCQHRKILGLAPIAHWNFFLGKMLAIILRIVAADLLAHDAAGRNAIDGDAMLSDLARQSLRPGVNRGLRRERGIESLGFGFPG